MTKFLFLVLIICLLHRANAQESLTIVPLDSLEDAALKHAVTSIFNGEVDTTVIAYKRKRTVNLVMNTYKSSNWRFYSSLLYTLEDDKSSGGNDFIITTPNKKGGLESIRFFHVKYMAEADYKLIGLINEDVRSYFKEAPTACSVNAYASQDRWTHYLHVQIKNVAEKIQYIFIVKASEFYKCVVSK